MEMLYGLIAAMSGQSNCLDHGGDLSNGLSASAPLDRTVCMGTGCASCCCD